MKLHEIVGHNVAMFKMDHGKPFADALCAEEKTLKKVMDSLLAEIGPWPTGQEFWGMKFYTEKDVPNGKVRFKIKGITVAEVYAFEPASPGSGER